MLIVRVGAQAEEIKFLCLCQTATWYIYDNEASLLLLHVTKVEDIDQHNYELRGAYAHLPRATVLWPKSGPCSLSCALAHIQSA